MGLWFYRRSYFRQQCHSKKEMFRQATSRRHALSNILATCERMPRAKPPRTPLYRSTLHRIPRLRAVKSSDCAPLCSTSASSAVLGNQGHATQQQTPTPHRAGTRGCAVCYGDAAAGFGHDMGLRRGVGNAPVEKKGQHLDSAPKGTRLMY